MDDDLWNEDFFNDEPMESINDSPIKERESIGSLSSIEDLEKTHDSPIKERESIRSLSSKEDLEKITTDKNVEVINSPTKENISKGYSVKRTLKHKDNTNTIDPLNWFVNIETKENDRKRQKLSEEQAILKENVKKIEKLKAIKFANSTKLHSNNSKKQEEDDEYLLLLPPIRFNNWLGISSVDNYCRRYITFDPIIFDEKQSSRLKLMSKKIEEIVKKVNESSCIIKDYLPENTRIEKNVVNNNKQMWIEKYSPTNFLDLLTDDKINRMSLCWLNLWNEYIFNTSSVHNKLSEYEQSILEIEGKNPCMPKKKIMIIHGPVGCGKSSLAMMVAKIQYNPFIINMSEITNVNELKRILLLASSYHAVNFNVKKNKPRCLIVDGIEYATSEIVNALLKWTTDRKKKNALRPIICTCNNLYVPALRDLRNNAFIIKATIDESRLLQRIQDICFKENVSASKLTLKSLVDGSNSDIRLCINTLQFQCDSIYSDTTINDLNSNHKSTLSIFEALETILTLNKHKNKMGNLISPKERYEQVLNVVSSRTDLEKFTELIFNNIPPICKSIKKIYQNSKDLSNTDITQTMVNSKHDYTLMTYCHNSVIKTHFNIAKVTHRRLNLSLNVRWKECQNEAQSRYTTHLNEMIETGKRKFFKTSTFLDKINLMTYDKDEYSFIYGNKKSFIHLKTV